MLEYEYVLGLHFFYSAAEQVSFTMPSYAQQINKPKWNNNNVTNSHDILPKKPSCILQKMPVCYRFCLAKNAQAQTLSYSCF